MAGFYDVLKIEPWACPEGCFACVEACAGRKEKKGVAVIRSETKAGESKHAVSTCFQCTEPKCLEACPTGAITKDEKTGVVHISEEECIGCEACVQACLYGQMYFDAAAGLATKCELCEGSPKCVEACPYGVVSFLHPSETKEYLGKDMVSKGVYLCQGCGAEIGLRFTQKVVGPGAVYFFTSGCIALVFSTAGPGKAYQCSSHYYTRMTNVAPSMVGVKHAMKRQGKDVPMISFVGDGATADIGFQGLSGAAERGENIIYICYDNQGYMNTGIQRSGSTPMGAWTATTPVGKSDHGKLRPAKNVPLLMAFNGAAYSATANIAFLEDYARKLKKALAVKDGMSFINLTIPCPTGWRYPTELTVEMGRLAVESNMYPLWEFERGEFHLTYEPKQAKPVSDFIREQRRFAHLNPEEIEGLQKQVNADFAMIKSLTEIKKVAV